MRVFKVEDALWPACGVAWWVNGTDLARIVRSEASGVHVLLVSGYADAEEVAPDLPRLTKSWLVSVGCIHLQRLGLPAAARQAVKARRERLVRLTRREIVYSGDRLND